MAGTYTPYQQGAMGAPAVTGYPNQWPGFPGGQQAGLAGPPAIPEMQAAMRDAATPSVPAPSVPGATGPARGGIAAPNPFFNPQDALLEAFSNMGLNPAARTPMVRALLKQADDLAYQTLARAQSSGGDLSNDQNMMGMFQDLVNQAIHGGKVFQSYGQDVLSSLAQAAQPGMLGTPGSSANSNILAQLFSDRNTGLNIASSLLYGGYNPNIGGALSTGLANAVTPYQQASRAGALEQGGANAGQSIIDFILQRLQGGAPQAPAAVAAMR